MIWYHRAATLRERETRRLDDRSQVEMMVGDRTKIKIILMEGVSRSLIWPPTSFQLAFKMQQPPLFAARLEQEASGKC